MAGREDYEDRKQDRIDRLNDAAYKASRESSAAFKRSHDLVKDIPLGQPNIHGALTGVMNKSRNAADRSVTLGEKASYYADKATAAEENTAISSDDPDAIAKLYEKLSRLEAKRDVIKRMNKERKKTGEEPVPAYMLTNLGGTIRSTKERIEQLKRLDSMPAEIIRFDGGEIISDADKNRVQIVFDERQDDKVTDKLKLYGFHWAPSEQAWQRLRNPDALYAAKRICGIGRGDMLYD